MVAVEFDRELAENLIEKTRGENPANLAKLANRVNTASSELAVLVDNTFASSELAAENELAKKLEIINTDFLQFDLRKLPKNYKVVANIPYYITNKIIMKLLTADNKPSLAVLLVQKEVAERLSARPGKMSVLSVATQVYANVQLGEIVPAKLFSPPPKVDSQIVILRPHSINSANPTASSELAGIVDNSFASSELAGKILAKGDEKAFFRLVKAGFSSRRKKLRTALAGGLNISVAEAEKLLQTAEIDPNRRAQDLAIDDWFNLYAVLSER
jgi:16S rRNA (adenine1518-N6/adenine1519-N6)-dimethyltransferase